MTEFDDYQDATERTAIYPSGETDDEQLPDIGVLYTTMGLTGEAGEVSEKVKKYIREGDEQYIEDLEDELGDVLWYTARLAEELDLSLSQIAEDNMMKLLDRQKRDVLTGEGDDR